VPIVFHEERAVVWFVVAPSLFVSFEHHSHFLSPRDAQPSSQCGTAYGLITAIQNIGLAILPLLVAAIRAHTGSYKVGAADAFVANVCC
jgi:hypothetical protein